jgi:hypothetical protein
MDNQLNRKRSTSTLANTISFTHARAPLDDEKSPTTNAKPTFGYLNKNGSSSTINSITYTLSNVGFTSIAPPQSPYSPESSSSAATSPVLGKKEGKLSRAKLFAKKTKELTRSKTLSEGHNQSFLKLNGHGHHGLSSSSSNSKVIDSGSTMYSFDPSQILDKDAVMKQLSDLNIRSMSFDEREQMADNLWATTTNALRPLFTIEVKQRLKLKTPIEDVSKMVGAFFKLRISNNVSSTNLMREIMDFMKEGFNILENELSFNEEIGRDYYYRMSAAWEYFFKKIYHYLIAVFQPLDAELEGSGTIVKHNSYWSEFADTPTPSAKKMILQSFRDHVVIPYFEMNIQIPQIQERERRLLVQCFGMLKSISSTSYNQRIIEHISGILEQSLTTLSLK